MQIPLSRRHTDGGAAASRRQDDKEDFLAWRTGPSMVQSVALRRSQQRRSRNAAAEARGRGLREAGQAPRTARDAARTTSVPPRRGRRCPSGGWTPSTSRAERGRSRSPAAECREGSSQAGDRLRARRLWGCTTAEAARRISRYSTSLLPSPQRRTRNPFSNCPSRILRLALLFARSHASLLLLLLPINHVHSTLIAACSLTLRPGPARCGCAAHRSPSLGSS